MSDPIVAPPVAAPAPAAPAPVATPPPVAAAPEPTISLADNPYSELDAQFKADDKAAASGTPPEKKPDAAPVAAPVASPKPTPAAKDPPREPKALREELERTRTELGTIKSSIPTLEAKIKEYEARGQDTEALSKRLEQLEKNLSDKEGEIRALRQETSLEFKERWDKPFSQQANYAKSMLEGLVKVDGTPFTWDGDFATLYGLPANKANAAAKEMLGEDASLVMPQIFELKKLDFQRQNALTEERANWKKKEETEAGQRVQKQEQIKQLVTKVRKELQDTVEDYRDLVEDKESADVRAEGYKIYDTKPQTLQQAIVRDETVRHRVAAHAPLKLQISRLKAELAKRDETIAKMKPKVPGENGHKNPGGERTGDVQPESYEAYLKREVDA